jgi:hypothetical protein
MKMLIVPDCPLVLSAMSSVVSLRFVVPTSVMWGRVLRLRLTFRIVSHLNGVCATDKSRHCYFCTRTTSGSRVSILPVNLSSRVKISNSSSRISFGTE